MNKDVFNKSLKKLMTYFGIKRTGVKKFLKIDKKHESSFSDLEHLKNFHFEKLDQYFSIYNDSEANIALSKRMPLMNCIFFHLLHVRYLIKKLAQKQSNPCDRENIYAKLKHFDIVMDFFYPYPIAREFYCSEDEVYYRICEAKKILKLIRKKEEGKEREEILDRARDVLDELENEVIEKRFEINNFSKYDFADKLLSLNEILFDRGIKKQAEIQNIVKALDVHGSLRLSKADSFEKNGPEENFNLVLDEFMDLEHFDGEIMDDFHPKIDTADYACNDFDDMQAKVDGKMPIYFIFKSCGRYIKTYIDKENCEKRTSSEFVDAVYGQYQKIRDLIAQKYFSFSSSDKRINENEKKLWEKMYLEIKSWHSSSDYLEKQGIAKKVRKSLSDDMKKNFTCLIVLK